MIVGMNGLPRLYYHRGNRIIPEIPVQRVIPTALLN